SGTRTRPRFLSFKLGNTCSSNSRLQLRNSNENSSTWSAAYRISAPLQRRQRNSPLRQSGGTDPSYSRSRVATTETRFSHVWIHCHTLAILPSLRDSVRGGMAGIPLLA